MLTANKTSPKKLQIMQNKIICIINFKHLNDRVKLCTLHKSMSVLLTIDVYKLETAKFMHSLYHRMPPENFNTYLNAQHSYNTRSISSDGYCLERVSTKSGQLSCTYVGVKIWNKIPLDIKKASKHTFCNH